jgi:apolipoprotein N-acyltransferase
MISTRFLRPIWSLATLAAIFGVLLAVMAVVSARSMAVPIFTGQGKRNAAVLATICVPVLQVGLVSVGTVRESAHPRTAIKLYVAAIILLIFLLIIPALA